MPLKADWEKIIKPVQDEVKKTGMLVPSIAKKIPALLGAVDGNATATNKKAAAAALKEFADDANDLVDELTKLELGKEMYAAAPDAKKVAARNSKKKFASFWSDFHDIHNSVK